MFLSWIKDQEEKHKFSEDYSILIGSFANPTMASKILDKSKNNVTAQTTNFDETFKQTEELLLEHLPEDKATRKKRKKLRRPQEMNG